MSDQAFHHYYTEEARRDLARLMAHWLGSREFWQNKAIQALGVLRNQHYSGHPIEGSRSGALCLHFTVSDRVYTLSYCVEYIVDESEHLCLVSLVETEANFARRTQDRQLDRFEDY
ncbi:MAG: hypothetical protein ACR2PL_12270 [Dehalococcoidia bacterium]